MSTSSTPGQGPLESSPPEAWGPLLRFARWAGRPLERFLHIQAASGILLLVAAAGALLWANSPWAAGYLQFWHTPVGVKLGDFTFERSLEWVVNDGLMAIFFFVVGMEIRREVYQGELSEWRRAALPAVAALGGMVAPAGLYLLFAGTPETRSGWGVPMATDIAFAVGILTLLGNRVPAALRVLLLALAVIDDLGAIIVIALFYSSGVALSGLGVALLGLGGIFLMQRLGVRSKLAYVVPAFVTWAGVYSAGIHPTIAGVIVGLITPVRAWLGPDGFVTNTRNTLEELSRTKPDTLSSHEFAGSLQRVNVARREALSPSESLIHSLHPFVAFGIMPLFALANAGVSISGGSFDGDSWRVATAVTVGLVVGKPLGVLLACGLALRLRLGTLPKGMSPKDLLVLGVVAGIGFTMSLFIAQLAFTDPAHLAAAKLGVLAASGIAAVLGLILGRLLLSPAGRPGAARTADEAERSTEL
ncbi:Na+/H+ antiporter NhaA [Corallococcus sp. BB11-1]|uniref:Na+/H+ antiporter NhaA n=1 Tax=Corallococcus sp. BB11-1 TaxID=2996783 RepID=UPI0022700FE8|nr:Na+/H+ antiporter NhaA [Corallococcus sp. BB11-1]MCY1035896.1 Na+/H+ antiporter NhaA [Corallococcus sp. BB11-1]